jgi:hypothetical protein
MKKNHQKTTIILVIMFLFISGSVAAGEDTVSFGRVSVFGGVGISTAYGEYPAEYSAGIEFSFYPGLRLRLNKILTPITFIIVDAGYLKTGFSGYVGPTDSSFWNSYDYVNLNIMFGTQLSLFYFAGGIYYGFGLSANSYREYTDEWVGLNANNDLGIVAEGGAELLSFLSVGVQARCGIMSIGSQVDIKNLVILGTLGIHVFRF